jgi:hypothetical protein
VSDAREQVPVLDAPARQLERRRPGRIENASPNLIPLLRGEGQQPCDDEAPGEHDLAPATGVAVAAVISGLIWLLIGCFLYFG